jgi:asparagine synthase (glutamine-hydrolysing)
MCGIVGVLGFQNSDFRVTKPYLARLRDQMIHRGPDGAGLWIDPALNVGLGHRRLAIVDLSPEADQPMCNEDESIWVSFNGEIYNHAELRQELDRIRPRHWKTDHSDTEVIVHAFEEWGIDCLNRFRGMFAIAIWDGRSREMWLIRDRIGIKPLYYTLDNGRLAFASEIKALFADPLQSRDVDEESLFHYLSFLTTPAPRTLYRGINKLQAGTWLRVRPDGSVQQRRYWDVWEHTEPLIGVPEPELIERLMAELRTAIRLRKMADVPIGVFLSGGIDSSLNATLFSEGESEQVHTFTVGYDGNFASAPNETEYARRTAARVGASHHEILLNVDDAIGFLGTMARLQDEPLADPVCVPLYYLSKLARDHGCIVCQAGEGADELFCGYPLWLRFLQLQSADRLPVPSVIKRLGLGALAAAGKDQTVHYEWLRRGANGNPVFWGGEEAYTHVQKLRLLHPDLRQRFRGLTSWDAISPIRERFLANAWDKSDLHWMSYLDLNLRLPELLLMRVDKMSMGVSLEARVPFLDHKFVELALSIPARAKLGSGGTKYLLKKAVRGLLPDEIIDRKKQGFNVPLTEWFDGVLGATTRSELQAFCADTSFLDINEVTKLLDSPARASAWPLLNFALTVRQTQRSDVVPAAV